MIEIIQQTEKNAESKLPKNIRQIGNPEKDFRIYMEDYVYTYLHPTRMYAMDGSGGALTEAGGPLPRLLILVGEINHFSNRSCAFICGAIQVENSAFAEGLPELNDDTWRKIHKELQQFFGKSEVVGWVLDIPGNELEVTGEMEEAHRENFVNPYQFFFLMDSKEREEAFYMWKNGHLSRKEGYFIYYEKNPGMQEYMISKREALNGGMSPSEKIDDQAARHYRAMMCEKRDQSAGSRGTGILSYLSSLLMVILLCTFSVALLGNIRRMEHMEQTISVMSHAMESTESKSSEVKHEEQGTEPKEKQVAVETVSGNVYPLPEGSADGTQPEADVAAALAQVGGTAEGDAAETPSSEGQPDGTQSLADEAAAAGSEAQPGTDAAASQPAAEDASSQPAAEDTSPQPAADEALAAAEPTENAGTQPQSEAELYRSQGYYIVQNGDSLRGICYKIYGTYKMTGPLCEANAIADQDYIYAGQKLILP